MPNMPGLINAILALTALIATMMPAYQGSSSQTDDDTIATTPVAVAPQRPQECPTGQARQIPPADLNTAGKGKDGADGMDGRNGDDGKDGKDGKDGGDGTREDGDVGGAAETVSPVSCPTATTLPEGGVHVPPEGGRGVKPSERPEAVAPVAPAPNGSKVPVGKTVLFTGDYETGDFSQWGTCQSKDLNSDCGPSYPSMTIVSGGQQRQGKHAAHFVVNDGDVPDFGGGERSEVSSNDANALTHEGDERWYEWSMKVGADFKAPEGWGLLFMQWHAGSGSPPLGVAVNSNGNLFLDNEVDKNQVQEIGPLPKGEWKDYVLHVKFSKDSSVGFVEVWENGRQVVPMTNRATMSGDENYLKQGIYRDEANTVTHEAWLDGLRITGP